MNKTEAEFAFLLTVRHIKGEIADFTFETDKLKLDAKTSYLPDFKIRHNDGTVEYVDVKGPVIDPKSIVKIKWAKQLHPECVFAIEQKKDGTWKRRVFK